MIALMTWLGSGCERTPRTSTLFFKEEQELTSLYEPLEKVIAAFGSSIARLRLKVRRAVDIEQWAAQGEEFLDLRTAGAFKGAGELARLATAELAPTWATGGGEEAAQSIKAFSARYSRDLRRQAKVDAGSDAYRAWERGVSRWLYGAEHVQLSYSLEYDGLSIERLSPAHEGSFCCSFTSRSIRRKPTR